MNDPTVVVHHSSLEEPPGKFTFVNVETIESYTDILIAADGTDLSLLTFFMVGSVKLFYFYKSDVYLAVQGHPRSLISVRIESAYISPL